MHRSWGKVGTDARGARGCSRASEGGHGGGEGCASEGRTQSQQRQRTVSKVNEMEYHAHLSVRMSCEPWSMCALKIPATCAQDIETACLETSSPHVL